MCVRTSTCGSLREQMALSVGHTPSIPVGLFPAAPAPGNDWLIPGRERFREGFRPVGLYNWDRSRVGRLASEYFGADGSPTSASYSERREVRGHGEWRRTRCTLHV